MYQNPFGGIFAVMVTVNQGDNCWESYDIYFHNYGSNTSQRQVNSAFEAPGHALFDLVPGGPETSSSRPAA